MRRSIYVFYGTHYGRQIKTLITICKSLFLLKNLHSNQFKFKLGDQENFKLKNSN